MQLPSLDDRPKCATQKPERVTAEARQEARRSTRGYRDPIRRTNASNSDDLALSKGPTRHDEQTAAHAALVAQIKATREKVWDRSDRCECCGDTERETATKCHKRTHEMHEYPTRAMTKGLPPADRFNVRICQRLCWPCHQLYQATKLRSLPWTADGVNGQYDVQRLSESGEWETVLTVVPRAVREAVAS